MPSAEDLWIDLSFPVHAAQGRQITSDYPLTLAQCVARILPWWTTEPNAGVHPLKGMSACGQTWLIGGRTRLTLRIPEARALDCAQLAGQEINLDGKITLGEPRTRSLLAHPVIYALCVISGDDQEASFVSYIRDVLDTLGISGQEIVGKKRVLQSDNGSIVGFSLMVAGLSLKDSIRVQQRGLGFHRSLGCGIFVPHRSINAVGL